MAVDVLRDVAASIGEMQQAVMRDPASREAQLSVAETVRRLDMFETSPEIQTFLRLAPEHRPSLPPNFSDSVQRLFDSVQDTLSVAIQVEQLGERVDWIVPLTNVLDRLERIFATFGVMVDRSWKPGPPIVSAQGGPDADGRSKLSISTKSLRPPELKPYIALAVRDAQAFEIEPGHWYVELSDFPGVWADGETPVQCLDALEDVLYEWLVLKVIFGARDLPILDDLDPRAIVLSVLPSV